MKPVGDRKRASIEKMGTVTINMDEYERTGADMEVLRTVINKIEDLPPLRPVVQKILSLTQDERPDTNDLARVISNDQALAVKVLRIVNSPLYHVSSVVTTISHAVALMGFRAIRNLALGLSTIETFNESEENHFLPRQRFWEHSLACAHCCKAVADRIRHRLPDEAFVGGLLHDIGEMVFNQFFPVTFGDALREAHMKRRPLVDLEKEEIGMPHTLAGKLLLQKWNLPPSIAEAVECRHNPLLEDGADPSKLNISLIIMVADTLTKIARIGFGGDSYIHDADQTVWKRIPLQEEDYVSILSNLSKHVQEIKEFFGIEDDPLSSTQPLADRENREPLRLAFYTDNGVESFIPARVMLQLFFLVQSFPIDEDIKVGIEEIRPRMVFVDLSSEHSTDRISETLKAYRSVSPSPMIFLLSRKVSKETQEKSARIGIFFLSTPFCPQEMYDCLSGMNLMQ